MVFVSVSSNSFHSALPQGWWIFRRDEKRWFPSWANLVPSFNHLSYRRQIQIQAIAGDANETPNFHRSNISIRDFDLGVDQTRFLHGSTLFHAKSKDDRTTEGEAIPSAIEIATAASTIASTKRTKEEVFHEITRGRGYGRIGEKTKALLFIIIPM